MRLHLIKNSYSDSLDRYMPGIVMKGKLEATFKVRDPMGLVVKEDVDKALTQFPPEWITKPFLPTAFPAFKGDFVKNDKGGYDLKFIHKNETTFKIPEVDYAGRLTKESGRGLNADDFDGFPFERIRDDSFPKKPEELGIDNNIPLDGSGSTNKFVHTTRRKLDKLLSGSKDLTTVSDVKRLGELQEPYEIGDIIIAHKDADIAKEGFFRFNGGLLSKKNYSELYEIIGDYYGMDFGYYGAGRPWHILDRINPDVDIPKFGPNTVKKSDFIFDSDPLRRDQVRGGYAIAVTDNLVHLIGGYNGDRFKPMLEVLTGKIHPGGIVKDWAVTLQMKNARQFARAVVANNVLYLVGGYGHPNNDTGGYKTLAFDIDGAGLLRNEREVGSVLPEQMSYAGVHINKRTIYCYGGHTYTASGGPKGGIESCYRSIILPNGELSPWVKENLLIGVSGDSKDVDAYRINGTVGYSIDFRDWKNNGWISNLSHSSVFISRSYDNDSKEYMSPNTKMHPPIYNPHKANFNVRSISTRKGLLTIYDTYSGGGNKMNASIMSVDGYGLPNKLIEWVGGSRSLNDLDAGRGLHEIFALKDNVIMGPGMHAYTNVGWVDSSTDVGKNPLRLETPGLGLNSYKEYYDGSRYLDGIPEDKFALPEIPDQLLDGELYSFFIKAK